MSSLLPPNATSLEQNVATLTERLEALPTNFERIWNPDTCAVELLPWLAWAFSVDEWDSSWPEGQKRSVIKNSAYMHKHKGTPAAVDLALTNLPFNASILEWFEQNPPSTPYTFLIQTDQAELSATDAETLMRYVNAAKNLRSHYVLETPVYVSGEVFTGGVVMSGQEVEIFYPGYMP